MGTKLNQIIAVEKGVKGDSYSRFTKIHQQLQKGNLLAGLTRTYEPKDEEGDRLPSESSRVQLKVEDGLREVQNVLTRMFDVTATKDWANTKAKADVAVNGTPLLTGVPVTYLLFLEKQLTDLRTFVNALPTLEPGENWTYNPALGLQATDPVKTVRTKKVPRHYTKAEATKEHPAQVEMYYEDVEVGTWTAIKYSGAIPEPRRREILDRIDELAKAVKFAREEANSYEVVDQEVGDKVFDYLFSE